MVDYTIAATPTVPLISAPQGGVSSFNPFQAMEEMARTQQLQNENSKFQLQLRANQGIAAMISQYPTIEAGLEAVSRSAFAPYASEYLKNMRDAQNSLANANRANMETTKGWQGQQDNAMQVWGRGMALLHGVIQRRGSMDEMNAVASNAIAEARASMPPGTPDSQLTALGSRMRAAFDSITQGNPEGEAGWQAMDTKLLNKMGALGFTGPDFDRLLLGENVRVDAGNTIRQYYIPPGGTMAVPSGPDIPKGAPPQYAPPRDVPSPALSPSGEPITSPAAGPFTPQNYPGPGTPPNALAPQAAPPPQMVPLPEVPSTAGALEGAGAGEPPALTPQPLGGPTASPGPTPASSAPAGGGSTPPPTAEPSAGFDDDPNPVVPKGPVTIPDTAIFPQHTGRLDAGGKPSMTQPEASKVEEKAKEYVGPGARAFNADTNTLAQMVVVNRALDRVAGSFVEPGAGGTARLAAAKQWNEAITQISHFFPGMKPEDYQVNTAEVQAAEGLQKTGMIARLSALVSYLGNQREAAYTIAGMSGAVPGLETSVLGDRLNAALITAQAQRGVDLRQWQEQWANDPRNPIGDMNNSEEEFNKVYPAQAYMDHTLERFGMSRDGFQSGAAITWAREHGYIDEPMAIREANKLREKMTPESQRAPTNWNWPATYPPPAPSPANQMMPPTTPAPAPTGGGFNPVSTLFPFR